MTLFDPPTGQALKDAALLLLEDTRFDLIQQARIALVKHLLTNATVTMDDIRCQVQLPVGINPVCFGSVPQKLAKDGIIRRAGYANTARPLGHSRPVSVWELADREKAEEWIRDNQETI